MSDKTSDQRVQPFSVVYGEFDIRRAKRLGAGGFGKVYLIAKRDSGDLFAAKYQKLTNRNIHRLVQQEAGFLWDLSGGQRVVQIYGYFEKERHSLMVLEYLEGGELFSRVGARNYDLTEEKCRRFVLEIVKGMIYIHTKEIIHLDIKPQNIMFSKRNDDYHLKIIDFGLAKKLTNGHVRSGFVGTVGFMAPEVAYSQYGHNSSLASPSTDMFSVGVVTYMLVSGGIEPFWENNDVRTIRNTLRRQPDFGHVEFDNVSKEAKDFISGLLEKEQLRRLSSRESLEHPWLEGVKRRNLPCLSDKTLYRLETLKMRRFMARYRWKRVIRAVRILIKVRNTFAGIPEDL